MKILIPSADAVVATNRKVCEEGGNPFAVLDAGKIESAIHTSFYPCSYPFAFGGVARLGGALCYYLIMAHAFMDGNKRTGATSSLTFMNINGWDLEYPWKERDGKSALANIIEECASGKMGKDGLIDWFELHKAKRS